MKLLKPLLTFIAAASFVVAAGFSVSAIAQTQEVLTTESIFESELQQRGIPFSKLEPQLYDVRIKRNTIRVSLSKIHKTFVRDGDPEAVKQFAASTLRPAFVLPTDWEKVKDNIFVYVMASETKGLSYAMYKRMSRDVIGALAYYDRQGSPVYILSTAELEKMNVSQQTAWRTAINNLDKIAAYAKLTFSEVNGSKIGTIETDGVYKASMILAPSMKFKVSKELGWPVLAVAPARDFVYLFSKESNLKETLAGTVVKEYKQASNPLSTEIWELSDGKFESIEAFPVR